VKIKVLDIYIWPESKKEIENEDEDKWIIPIPKTIEDSKGKRKRKQKQKGKSKFKLRKINEKCFLTLMTLEDFVLAFDLKLDEAIYSNFGYRI